MTIAEKIAGLRKSIGEIALRAGRRPDEIQFVLVTKTISRERIAEAVKAGVSDFGENRVQELLSKKKTLVRPCVGI